VSSPFRRFLIGRLPDGNRLQTRILKARLDSSSALTRPRHADRKRHGRTGPFCVAREIGTLDSDSPIRFAMTPSGGLASTLIEQIREKIVANAVEFSQHAVDRTILQHVSV